MIIQTQKAEACMSLGISISSLAKSFDGKVILKDVSLELPAGRSTVLIGPSACGKSVLVRCILGLMSIDGGKIRIGDQPPRRTSNESERIGVLFQQNALFDSMTVWENVAFPLINTHGLSRRLARDRAIDTLLQVSLSPDIAMLYPVELSGGMQKRVAVARAMVGDPDLLILDDPTAGLDPILTNAILELIESSTASTGATVLAITGDMAVARSRFDRIAMLYGGVIRWSGDSVDAETADDPYLQQMLEGRAEGPIQMRISD
jgi:phospholipid/cholesterol/gamma-HCH transport system ATP-binding protein